MTKSKFAIEFFLLYFCFFCIVINPYTIIAPLGLFASIVVISIFFVKTKFNFSLPVPLLLYIVLLFISVFGAFVSYYRGIPQFNHVYTMLSLLIVTLSSVAIFKLFHISHFKEEKLLLLFVLVVFTNCFVILLELFFPFIRETIESFLLSAGNRDWDEGFRYRGLASSGGAALSMLSPISILLSCYLYKINKIKMVLLIINFVVVIFATMVIGRTGLLLSFICLFYLVSGRNFFKIFLICIFFVPIIAFIFIGFKEYLITIFGEGFINYSFGFIFKGAEGVKSEGTVNVLVDFIQTVPTEFPYIFTGYGFYGGSEFYPWTDSGFARTMLSVGWVFGIIFYITFFLYISFYKKITGYFMFIFMVLILGELKEPILYSGYAFRLMLMIAVISYLYNQSENYERHDLV